MAGREAGVWTSLVAGISGLAPFLHVVSRLLLFVATPLNLSTQFHQQSSQTIYMAAQDIQEAKIETSSLLKTSLATGTASLLVKAVTGSPDSRQETPKRHEFQEAWSI